MNETWKYGPILTRMITLLEFWNSRQPNAMSAGAGDLEGAGFAAAMYSADNGLWHICHLNCGAQVVAAESP